MLDIAKLRELDRSHGYDPTRLADGRTYLSLSGLQSARTPPLAAAVDDEGEILDQLIQRRRDTGVITKFRSR
jgi:hypothetical protein